MGSPLISYRALATLGDFMRDTIKLYVMKKQGGTNTALELTIADGPSFDELTAHDFSHEGLELPRELAVALFNALGQQLTGSDVEPYNRIQQLENQLHHANVRVDSLIRGIGRLGGSNAGS